MITRFISVLTEAVTTLRVCHGVDLCLVRLIYAIADGLGDSPLRAARIPHSFWFPHLSSWNST